MNNTAALFTHRIVTYTEDYAIHSSYLNRYLKKLRVIPPPVVLPKATQEQICAFGDKNNPQKKHPVIGMAARFATEKGVEILVNALPLILEKYPDTVVHFAGPYQKIIGEEAYFERLAPKIDQFEKNGHWKFLGSLDPQQMSEFYPNIDLLVLSSLNSTEAFGLVQIEAMINGVPCVASDLPGVRQPIKRHGMGKIISIGDAAGLAQAAIEILAYPMQYIKPADEIEKVYLPDTIAIEYEKLFGEMFADLGKSPDFAAAPQSGHNNPSTDHP
jgi:glycosyltransferase involved in cell wall biosynthesis